MRFADIQLSFTTLMVAIIVLAEWPQYARPVRACVLAEKKKEYVDAARLIGLKPMTIQAQVLNLLMEAREERHLTYLFITHDLSVVEHFGTRVAVMYLGRICELGITSDVFSSPRHPYTQALLSAIPKLSHHKSGHKSKHIKLKGEVPTPINLPSGCVFHGRCPHASQRCRDEIPELNNTSSGVQIACHAVQENRI